MAKYNVKRAKEKKQGNSYEVKEDFSNYEFKFYSDEGHGWVAVPVKLLQELGIDKQITSYSYLSHVGNIAYLEEDADATLFEKAYKEKYGKSFAYESIIQDGGSPIRNYPSYRVSSLKEELKDNKSQAEMQNTFKLLKADFESSSTETPQFRKFHNTFKKEFSGYLKEKYNAKDVVFNKGHFYTSGFFELPNGKIYYFNLGDVRFNKMQMLVRTAKDFKDYSGGRNNYVRLDRGQEAFNIDLEQIFRFG